MLASNNATMKKSTLQVLRETQSSLKDENEQTSHRYWPSPRAWRERKRV